MKKSVVFVLIIACLATAMKPSPIDGQIESRYMSRASGPDQGYDVQVSTVLRAHTLNQPYFPLLVQVHNWKVAQVRVSPEQFTLVDKEGRLIKPITVDEYMEKHRLQGRRNLTYLSRHADTGFLTKPKIWYIERSRFYPLGGSREPVGAAYQNVNLRPNYYLVDWLYFPQQAKGAYKLIFTDDEGHELVLPVNL